MRGAASSEEARPRLSLNRRGGAGVIRGYASLFDSVDLSGDRVDAGAFRASLARRGPGGIRMLWQHDPGRPIGVWNVVAEDRTGLLVEGRLALETCGGREAFALIEAGAVDGLSIGFRTKRARPDTGPGGARRRLVEIDLWEISVVTFPMQERARLIEVRASGSLHGKVAAGQRSPGRIGSPSGARTQSLHHQEEKTCPRS